MEKSVNEAIKLFGNKKFDDALNLFLKEMKNISDENSCIEKAELLDYIGRSYRHLKDYENALKYLNEALELTEESDQTQVCLLLRNIGSCHSANGNHIESLKCLQKSLRLAREVKDRESEASLLFQIGTQQFDSGKTQKALKTLQKSFELYKTIGLKAKADKVYREIKEIKEDIKDEKWIDSKVGKFRKYNFDKY